MSGDRLRELFDQHAELPGDGQPVPCLEWEQFEAAARALLAEAQPAQPEPVGEGPTRDELLKIWRFNFARTPQDRFFDIANEVLARWGRPAPEPVSVAERMPEAKHCTTNPRTGDGQWCWGWVQHDPVSYSGRWRMMPRAFLEDEARFWLPHWALPVPLPTTEQ